MTLREQRHAKKWSLSQMSIVSGVCVTTIKDAERGERISLSALRKIRAALASDATPAKLPQGFACMPPQAHREIASRGGQAVHELGRGRTFTRAEARAAGRKGGDTIGQDREHMRAIGRRGGLRKRNQNETMELSA